MRIIKIKNNQSTADTYCGMEIQPEEYYQIQSDSERENFANDKKVNQDMWSETPKISINDGENDLIHEAADKYLKGTNIQKTTARLDEGITSIRPIGMLINATKNIETTHDLQLQSTVRLKGGIFRSNNAKFGDYIKVSIVDKDGVGVLLGLYTQEQFDAMGNLYELKTFIPKWMITPGENNELIDIDLSDPVPEGLYIRVTYNSYSSATEDMIGIINILSYTSE